MEADLELAFALADHAATISLPAFERRSFAVRAKEDGSPVTDADEAVERMLRERLARERPAHAVLGEEHGLTGPRNAGWRWYLDPIDGTRIYVDGRPGWMTLLALTFRGRVVMGVIDRPALGERCWALQGAGAFCDGRRLAVSDAATLAQAVVNDDHRGTLARGDDSHPLAALAARAAGVRPHDGHSFLAVARGEADVAAGRGGKVWDYAPLQILVEEAGGRFTDWTGAARFDAGAAMVSNGRLHEEALAVLASA